MPDDLAEYLKHTIPLSEMIATLRQELTIAANDAPGKAIRFIPGDVELELEIVVTDGGTKGGGIRLGVASAALKKTAQHVQTHTFKLKLTPVSGDKAHEPAGGGILIGSPRE